MTAYLDASVILRALLGESDSLPAWRTLTSVVASALAEVECLRTLDRLMRTGRLAAEELAERRSAVYRLFEAMDVVDVTPGVLRRAAEPFPTPLGTLDAIHLATALLWREARGSTLAMATHDQALATAARAMGLEVLGA